MQIQFVKEENNRVNYVKQGICLYERFLLFSYAESTANAGRPVQVAL